MKNISLFGIGWIHTDGYGCIMKEIQSSYVNRQGHSLMKKKLFSCPFKNFGRLDALSKMTCYAVALALQDAGMHYSAGQKQDIGIIGTNASGSLQSDIDYFEDYLNTGRTLSRGNLFIYTLPTSPLAEAAIYFGLQGPLLYATSPDGSLASILAMATEMILLEEIPVMLAGMAEEDEAVYCVLMRGHASDRKALCDVDKAMEIVRNTGAVSEMIQEFSAFRKGNILA
jgi:3-oxoacyl-[acyl-carrier-protein] synthase II